VKRETRKTAGARRPVELIDYAVLGPVADVLKAVAHPVRLRITEVLAGGELCVSEIMEALGTKPAITSQQLGRMRDKGVLESRREGNRVYYRVTNPHVVQVIDCIRKAAGTCAVAGPGSE
jgi:ArsR family transcriptional regulator